MIEKEKIIKEVNELYKSIKNNNPKNTFQHMIQVLSMVLDSNDCKKVCDGLEKSMLYYELGSGIIFKKRFNYDYEKVRTIEDKLLESHQYIKNDDKINFIKTIIYVLGILKTMIKDEDGIVKTRITETIEELSKIISS